MTVTGGTVVVVAEVTSEPRMPDVFVLGGLVVVVGGAVVAVVLWVGVRTGGALAGDVVTGGDVLLRRNGGEMVVVPTAFVTSVVGVPATFVGVVVVLAVAVGGVVVPPFTCWMESVGGGVVSVSAKAHTAPLAASTATTSATPGYQTPSR
jgi:hypothetical protein